MTAGLTKSDIDNVDNNAQIKQLGAQKAMRCRTCNGSLSRIKRGPLIKTFLFWLPVKRYVCYRCNNKTYRIDKTAR